MNHYQNLGNYVDELVSYRAKFNGETYVLTLADLDEDELEKLAALKIEESERDLSECVYGDDFTINNDYVCALLKMLKNNTQENRDNLARVLTVNIIIYFSKSLQQLMDDCCNEYIHRRRNEAGFTSDIRDDNGELYWRHN